MLRYHCLRLSYRHLGSLFAHTDYFVEARDLANQLRAFNVKKILKYWTSKSGQIMKPLEMFTLNGTLRRCGDLSKAPQSHTHWEHVSLWKWKHKAEIWQGAPMDMEAVQKGKDSLREFGSNRDSAERRVESARVKTTEWLGRSKRHEEQDGKRGERRWVWFVGRQKIRLQDTKFS